jgi:multiple sugar transport system substrate-binding protein
MKKRSLVLIALILAAIIVTGLFIGCGKGSAGSGTVIFYLWEDPAYKPIVDAFNSSQDEVFVDAQYIPTNEYEAKISVLLAGGAEMDGYMQKRSTDIFVHNDNGYLAELDGLCKKYKFDLDAIKGYKDAITIDGKTLAIPFRGASYFTYFNRKIFEKAGVPTPDTYVESGEWTWPKFIEVAKEVTEKAPGNFGGFLYTWGSNNVMPALQNGIQFLDQDGNLDINDSLINSYKYRNELEKAGAIMTLSETRVTKTHYSKPFYEGKVGMLIIGEWFPGHMRKGRDENLLQGYTWDDWSLTRMPCDESDYRTFGNPTFSHIYAKSKKKDAMFKFISWMGGPEGAKIVASAGLMPAYITEDVKEEFKKILPDETALKYYTEPRTVKTQFYNKYGSKVENELAAIMEEYLASPVSDAELESLIEARLKKVAEQVE